MNQLWTDWLTDLLNVSKNRMTVASGDYRRQTYYSTISKSTLYLLGSWSLCANVNQQAIIWFSKETNDSLKICKNPNNNPLLGREIL